MFIIHMAVYTGNLFSCSAEELRLYTYIFTFSRTHIPKYTLELLPDLHLFLLKRGYFEIHSAVYR